MIPPFFYRTKSVLLIAACVAGCSINPRYVPPASGSIATVRLAGTVPLTYIFENGTNCSEQRGWPEGAFRLVEGENRVDPQSTLLQVATDKPIAFKFVRHRLNSGSSDGLGVSTCDMLVSLQPLPDRNYVIEFGMSQEMCGVILHETTSATSFDYKPSENAEFRLREKNTAPGTGGLCAVE